MRVRGAALGVIFLPWLVGMCTTPTPAGAAMPPDLKLRETSAQKIIVSPRSNPHELMQCSDCHPVKPTRSPELAPKTESMLKEEYPDTLCLRCHKEKCGHHPQGVTVLQGPAREAIPKVFPLRYIDDQKSHVVCMTCHDIHYPHTGHRLLRGYAVNPSVQPTQFVTRLDFCRGCHGQALDLLSPHRTGKNQKGCVFCHTAKPEGGKPEPLRDNANSLCAFCHSVYPEPHYFHYNPFPGLPASTGDDAGIPLSYRPSTCVTCHQPHGPTPEPSYLRTEYLKVALTSARVNPHRGKVFCGTCHADAVRPGSKAKPLLREADSDTLCNRCHDSGVITGMDHPLQAPPVGFKAPATFPVTPQGNLTCTTCHQPGCGRRDPGNVDFLRGGPYQDLGAFCRLCHPDQRPPANPHPEIARGKGCERCHHEGTTYQVNGVQIGSTRADNNLVCLICHGEFPHPADYRHTGRPGQYEYVLIRREYPLDRFGRITCYTCHQVHQVPPSPDFLRRPSFGADSLICAGCHPY